MGNDRTAFGAHLPDFGGCATAGDTIAEALRAAEELLAIRLEELAERGEPAPAPGRVKDYMNREEYAGHVWAWVSVDPVTRPVGLS